MAGIFNPSLGGGAASFSPPSNEPSGISALANLAGGFASTIRNTEGGGPSKSERFNETFKLFRENEIAEGRLDPSAPLRVRDRQERAFNLSFGLNFPVGT